MCLSTGVGICVYMYICAYIYRHISRDTTLYVFVKKRKLPFALGRYRKHPPTPLRLPRERQRLKHVDLTDCETYRIKFYRYTRQNRCPTIQSRTKVEIYREISYFCFGDGGFLFYEILGSGAISNVSVSKKKKK